MLVTLGTWKGNLDVSSNMYFSLVTMIWDQAQVPSWIIKKIQIKHKFLLYKMYSL